MKPTCFYLSLGTAIMAIAMMLTNPHTTFACSLNPTANITSPESHGGYYMGDPVLFDGTTSTANCGTITSYTWYVRPNGFVGWTQVSTGSIYQYNFPSTGSSWQVRLTVTNSAGKSHTRILIGIKVENQPRSQYYLTDHLGSVRVTLNDTAGVVGWDDYYPFGLVMPGRSGNNTVEHDLIKFTGYELEREGGQNLYYAGARMYDPEIGRFMSLDPLAAMYPGWSPYTYTFNNPIRYVDLTGLCPEDGSAGWTDEYGERTWCAASVTKTADRYNDDSEWASSLEVDGWEVSGSRIFFDASKPVGAQNLYNHLRETGSACEMVSYAGFSETARKIAMTACIHGGQAAFLTNSLKFSATAVGILALTYTGVGVIAGSYGLIAVGTTFSTGATILNISASLSEGNIEAALPQLLLGGATRGIYSKIGTTRSLGNITNLERSALTFPVFSSEIIGNFTIMYLTD